MWPSNQTGERPGRERRHLRAAELRVGAVAVAPGERAQIGRARPDVIRRGRTVPRTDEGRIVEPEIAADEVEAEDRPGVQGASGQPRLLEVVEQQEVPAP